MALCEGRHPIFEATDGAIYPMVLNPLDIEGIHAMAEKALQGIDVLHLYVTGLTVTLIEVINVCRKNAIDLTLYHFNRENGNYYPQKVIG